MVVVAIADVTEHMVTVIADDIEVMVETERLNLPAPVGEQAYLTSLLNVETQGQKTRRTVKALRNINL